MASLTPAWDKLMATCFAKVDAERLERKIGYVLLGFRPIDNTYSIIILTGPPACGKSTVLHIIRKLFNNENTNRIYAAIFHDWDLKNLDQFNPNGFIFTATNITKGLFSLKPKHEGYYTALDVMPHKCGSAPLPLEEYRQLVREITTTELDAIADKCKAHVKKRFPKDHFQHP